MASSPRSRASSGAGGMGMGRSRASSAASGLGLQGIGEAVDLSTIDDGADFFSVTMPMVLTVFSLFRGRAHAHVD